MRSCLVPSLPQLKGPPPLPWLSSARPLHLHQRWELPPSCPHEPAPHTGAFDSHLSAVRSLGGQRWSARGSFYPSPNLITLVNWGHQAPQNKASINSTHPISQSLGNCPIYTRPRALRTASPAITFYIDACFFSGDGVRWEDRPPAPPHCAKFSRFLH